MPLSSPVKARPASAPAVENGPSNHPPTHPQSVPVMRRSSKQLTIVIKLGTSSICDEVTHEPLLSTLSMIVETCIKLRRLGHRVILVSSGAIGIGLRRLNIDKRPKRLSAAQAIAAVGQCRLIALWDELFKQLKQPIAQILLTRNDIADRTQYLNAANTFTELLDMGIIPIVNENDTLAVTEIKFGDNDTLSAITAGMVNADYLFLMTDVDCLYDKNPRSFPDAKPVEVVDDISALDVDVSSAGSSLGTGGMSTKLTAARLATSAGVTTVIAHSRHPERIFEIVAYVQTLKRESGASTPLLGTEAALLEHGFESLAIALRCATPDSAQVARSHPARHSSPPRPINMPVPLHTRFTAKPRAIRDRYFWILHGLKPHGTVVVDEGAYRALTRSDKAGLLPVGIIDVKGTFGQQECVSIAVGKRNKGEGATGYNLVCNEAGRALVNYTSVEISHIMGHHSSEIDKQLGYADSEYVAYRDNIAFFDEKSNML
ncbi:glutamate 5-kinase [Ascodesmis nigricans]|uniref:Glutamate 5-kinase n=1 Tax=Ascodesmis nigricans TaxID=341454 RepID=A0A4S2N7V8_9PEZI|nr:glutamate 5-kinase [Ascodesmis nigricans]